MISAVFFNTMVYVYILIIKKKKTGQVCPRNPLKLKRFKMLVLKEESVFGRFFCNWDFILRQGGLQILFPNITRIIHTVLNN